MLPFDMIKMFLKTKDACTVISCVMVMLQMLQIFLTAVVVGEMRKFYDRPL